MDTGPEIGVPFDNILVPTVNDTELIQILDIYPNTFILDWWSQG